MDRAQLIEALEQADAEGWHYVANKAPKVGERVDVMHIGNRSYDTDGECDEAGVWHCCNGFVLPNGMLTFSPTHWRPKAGAA